MRRRERTDTMMMTRRGREAGSELDDLDSDLVSNLTFLLQLDQSRAPPELVPHLTPELSQVLRPHLPDQHHAPHRVSVPGIIISIIISIIIITITTTHLVSSTLNC